MDTGASQLVMSLEKMAGIASPGGWPVSYGKLYIFRSDWNTTGSRFVTYLKSTRRQIREQGLHHEGRRTESGSSTTNQATTAGATR